MSCPDPEILIAYSSGKLSAEAATEVERHAEGCHRCAARLADMPIDEPLLAELRDMLKARDELQSTLNELADSEERITSTLFPRKDPRLPA